MDIYEVRRNNLRSLIDIGFEGNHTAFSKSIGINMPQIHRWVTKNKDARKNISEKSARTLEKLCNKPEFWLDQPPNAQALSVDAPLPVDLAACLNLFYKLLSAVEKLPPEQGELAFTIMQREVNR
ncbi:MAG: hypothetical protein LBG61_04050 [Burkholderiales bacterium]|jgi:hypothetical protein|nr:hypothetical protein [Burkholderiales bacterium]